MIAALRIAAASGALAAAGCVSVPDKHPLDDTKWQLSAIHTAGSTTTLAPSVQARHTLSFLAGGELQAKLDCNRGRGSWNAGRPINGAGAISLGPLTSTRMACPQPGFGDQMASGLAEAQRFTLTLDGRELVIDGPTLRLTFAAGN